MAVVYRIIGRYAGGGWVAVKVNSDELAVVALLTAFNREIDGLWRGVL